MPAIVTSVQNGQIDGINQAALDEACQFLRNPNAPSTTKAVVQACLVQLSLHLLQDPARTRSAEFQQLSKQVRDLTNEKNNLQTNYQNLSASNQNLTTSLETLNRVHQKALEIIAAGEKRQHVWEVEFCQKQIDDYMVSYNLNRWGVLALGVVTGGLGFIPIAFFSKQIQDERRRCLRCVWYWEGVQAHIRNLGLTLEEARKREDVFERYRG